MFLRKLQANFSNHAVTLLLIDWYQYHLLLLFAVSDRKSRATNSAVRTCRIISSFTPHSTSPIPWAEHLLLVRWCLSSYKQWYRLHVMHLWDSKGSVNLLRINYVSLTNSHTPRGAFEEKDQPAGLSSIHIPILGRVWYHAPWLRHCMKYRLCGLLLFGYLPW